MLSLQSRHIKSSCLDTARRNLPKQGFSQELCDRTLGPQCKSTRKLHGAGWNIFCSWCKCKQRDPLKATAPLIADFYSFSFEIQETKERYRMAIADFLNSILPKNFNDNIFLKLTKSFKSEAPKPKNIFPKWDLTMILSFLIQHPFEALSEADLKLLSCKTVFLVTLALAGRSSEVQAFSFAESELENNCSFRVLATLADFQLKSMCSRCL